MKSLGLPEDTRNVIDSYVSAVNAQWLEWCERYACTAAIRHKDLMTYLSSIKEPLVFGRIDGVGKRRDDLIHFRKERRRSIMALQKARSGTAKEKRNSWSQGNGSCSMREELKGGISKNKKMLNRKVRHAVKIGCRGSGYKKVCQTVLIVNFT